jgi:membrane protease YdiL (CAAX protease family)
MFSNTRAFFAILTAGLAACAGALLAGNLSSALAHIITSGGGPHFVREPINVLLALALLWAWQRWRQNSLYSPPKWGHVALGLVIGLGVGIALPAIALAIMWVGGVAVITAPKVAPVVLAVPFIFLIVHACAEESLIRGIAQREGHNVFGPLGGVALAAISFGALQTLQGFAGAWQIVNSALFGAVLGFLALGPGGIWAAVGAHAGWSWLEVAVLGEDGQIVKTTAWLAGTGRDSYGSPAFTLVLVTTLGLQILLHLRAHKRKV